MRYKERPQNYRSNKKKTLLLLQKMGGCLPIDSVPINENSIEGIEGPVIVRVKHRRYVPALKNIGTNQLYKNRIERDNSYSNTSINAIG